MAQTLEVAVEAFAYQSLILESGARLGDCEEGAKESLVV